MNDKAPQNAPSCGIPGTAHKSPEIFINATLAYCTDCGKTETARIIARDSGVYMERMCPAGGVRSVKIAARYSWYMDRVVKPQTVSQPKKIKESKKGCPEDCGLCGWHTASIQLPVFSITNACNMDCPICFTYNRKDQQYFKSLEDTNRILDAIFENAGDVQLINMTGGEPTLHPGLPDLVAAAYKRGIKRVTVNTNGLKLAEDKELAQKIKESGAHMVLSLDTMDPEKSIIIHGMDVTEQKRKALEVLETYNIPTTILSVCIKGVNEEDVREIADEYIGKNFVRSVTIQNMTYTGEQGRDFTPRDHITIDEVESLLARNEKFEEEDFFSLGSYHPLCYSVAYYIVYENKTYSLTKVLDPETLSGFTADNYFLDPNRDFSRDFRDGINRLWAEGEDEDYLKVLRKILEQFYPHDKIISREERNRLGEEMVKMVYIHPHMDEDNFDIDRVSRCGDVVPDESGQMVPACSYNLLYRQRDERFWK
ncbi:MAG: radical SAM protein [bacterium]|nr:radical SAM protein [bacterium]